MMFPFYGYGRIYFMIGYVMLGGICYFPGWSIVLMCFSWAFISS